MRVWLAILVLGVVVSAGLSIHLVERASPAATPDPDSAPADDADDATFLAPGAPTLPDPSSLTPPPALAANGTGLDAPDAGASPSADAAETEAASPPADATPEATPGASGPAPDAAQAPAPPPEDNATADAPPPTPPPGPPAPWTRSWTHRYSDAARVLGVEVEPGHPHLELEVVFTRDSRLPLVIGSGEVSLASPGQPAAVATCNTPAVPDALQRCMRVVNLPPGGAWELRFVGSGEILATVTLRAT